MPPDREPLDDWCVLIALVQISPRWIFGFQQEVKHLSDVGNCSIHLGYFVNRVKNASQFFFSLSLSPTIKRHFKHIPFIKKHLLYCDSYKQGQCDVND